MNKQPKKLDPLERIAIALESIGLSLKEKSLSNDVDKSSKLIIKEFPDFVGKPRKELYEHLKKEYPNQLPGENEILDIFKNPEKYPELKDGNYYYFFGATFCDADGNWRVPCVRWLGSKFDRHGNWLVHDWYGRDCVVFLEIAP